MLNRNFIKIGERGRKILFLWNLEYKSFENEQYFKQTELHCLKKDYFQKLTYSTTKNITLCGKIATWKSLNSKKINNEYINLLTEIKNYILTNKIQYIVSPCNILNLDFIKFLKQNNIISILTSADEPEGSEYYSKPACKYFDKIIHCGVYYNQSITINEMFYKWGAKNVEFIPIYPHIEHYDNETIDYDKKDIDLVYIGAITYKKWKRLYILNKYFKDNFKLYSHYDPRNSKSIIISTFYKLLNLLYPLPKEIKNLNDQEVKEIYKRSKIGYNEHLSYGPSNSRTYELPLNGVLEITDNEKGHKDLFEVGKEIICYENKNIKEAISKIEYYLKNDKERIKVAKAGYEKAINNYTYIDILKNFDKNITNINV